MTDTIDKRSLITIRPGVDDDLPFVYSTWLKGLRYGNAWFELIDQKAYFSAYHDVLERLLARKDTFIAVACLVEDPSVIIGYSVYEGDVLHFVFVKKRWRNIGICRDLVPQGVSVVTHITDVGRSLLKKSPGVRFNPFLS